MIASVTAATGIALGVFLVIDFIWLSNAGRLIYRPLIGDLLLDRPSIPPAIAFYLLYAIGLGFLVIRPAVEAGSLVTALWMGCLFGLVAYGTYDLTNAATLKGWSTTVTIIDMAWGALLTGASATIGVWAARVLT
jgi:uncharacterized membrane protein